MPNESIPLFPISNSHFSLDPLIPGHSSRQSYTISQSTPPPSPSSPFQFSSPPISTLHSGHLFSPSSFSSHSLPEHSPATTNARSLDTTSNALHKSFREHKTLAYLGDYI